MNRTPHRRAPQRARTRGRRTGPLVATVAVGALVLAGCGGGPSRPPERVAVLGDSISVGVADDLAATDPDDTWDVRALGGATAVKMAPAAPELAASGPDQAVVELGTNDVSAMVPWDRTRAALEQILDAFAGVRCVHLVTVATNLPGDTDGERATEINDWLAARADAEPGRVRLVDWGSRVSGPDGADLLEPDGVHPNADGQVELASDLTDSLDRCRG